MYNTILYGLHRGRKYHFGIVCIKFILDKDVISQIHNVLMKTTAHGIQRVAEGEEKKGRLQRAGGHRSYKPLVSRDTIRWQQQVNSSYIALGLLENSTKHTSMKQILT